MIGSLSIIFISFHYISLLRLANKIYFVEFQIQKYDCTICDKEFSLPSHCERHITTVHSGFGHKCTSCGNTFSRTDQKHGCPVSSFQLIKKSTGTFTGDEAIEFQTFQRNRSKFCNPVQRPVCSQLGNTNLARSKRTAQCLEPLPKKKRCYGLPPSAGPSRTIIPLMSLKIPVPKSSGDSLTPKDPVSASSTVSPDTSTSAALSVKPASSKALEIPLPDLNKDLALSESDKNSIYSKTTLVSKRSNPDQLSIHTDGVIDPEPGQEYAVPDLPSSTPYIPTNKLSLKVKDIIAKQDEVVNLNIGGTMFTTTRSTLREDPSSLLATLSSKLPSTPFFIDRNPKHFPFILDFLRNSCCVSSISIPTSVTALKELSQECAFYEIDVLCRLIESMLKLFSHQ